MADLARTIWAWEHQEEPEMSIDLRPRGWEEVFRMLAQAVGDRRAIIILDELPYAAQQDPGLASHIQAAWDHRFKESNQLLFLAGSHIGMMVELMSYQAPLGRRSWPTSSACSCSAPAGSGRSRWCWSAT
jgi:AAA+ ATPase superfamily predicted ATPase